jgi:hypothetical protein
MFLVVGIDKSCCSRLMRPSWQVVASAKKVVAPSSFRVNFFLTHETRRLAHSPPQHAHTQSQWLPKISRERSARVRFHACPLLRTVTNASSQARKTLRRKLRRPKSPRMSLLLHQDLPGPPKLLLHPLRLSQPRQSRRAKRQPTSSPTMKPPLPQLSRSQ